jgi:hypothetical protein
MGRQLRRSLAILLAAVVGTTAGLVGSFIATPAFASAPGPFEIISNDTGYPTATRCIDVESWSQANGARVQLYTCRAAGYIQSNQSFFLYPTGYPNVWSIRASHSAKCLDIKDYSPYQGALVQQWDCTDMYNQQFELAYINSSDFYIKPLTAAWPDTWCLKISGFTGDGSNIMQSTCTASPNTLWHLRAV